MTLVSTNHWEYDSQRLVLDILDATAIWYLVSNIDEESGSNGTAEGDKDEGDEDDSDSEEGLDKELQKTAREVANKTDDSGFWSGVEDNSKIEVLAGPGIIWTTGTAPLYPWQPTDPTSSSQDNSNTASQCGASFNAYLQENTSWYGIMELMGGQRFLHDHTTEAELTQLQKLVDKQIQIACWFNSKFSKMAFTLLQKTQWVFLGTSSIVKKFVDNMATAGLNLICDAAVYESELLASDGMCLQWNY